MWVKVIELTSKKVTTSQSHAKNLGDLHSLQFWYRRQ